MNPDEGRINGTIIYKNLRQKNTFSDDDDDLKKLLESTTNISNTLKTIPTIRNLKEFFLLD